MKKALLSEVLSVLPKIRKYTPLNTLHNIEILSDDEGNMVIRGTNLDMWVTATLFSVKGPDKVIRVDKDSFSKMLKASGKNISFDDTSDETTLGIVSEDGTKFNILRTNSMDYPEWYNLDNYEEKIVLQVCGRDKTKAFLDKLEMFDKFVAKEDYRPALNMIHIDTNPSALGKVKIVATDGHRLALIDATKFAELGPDTDKISPICMYNCVSYLPKIKGADFVKVAVFSGRNGEKARYHYIGITSADDYQVEIVTTVMDSEYPPYERVIPTNCDKKISIPIKDIRTIGKVTKGNVYMTVHPTNKEGVEVIEYAIQDEPKQIIKGRCETANIPYGNYKDNVFRFGFNGKWFSEMAEFHYGKDIPDDYPVIIHFTTHSNAFMVKDGSEITLLMPVRVSNSEPINPYQR